MIAGPNTGLGHSSMVYMIESHVAHVMSALETMDRAGAATAEPRQEALDRFIAEIDGKMGRTVWASGCKSWYQDPTGRISVLWPDWTWKFRREVKDFDPAEYRLSKAPVREAVAA
jgi:cyclohexanone monooxygenase